MIGPRLPGHIHFCYTQWALTGGGQLRIFLKPLHLPVTFPWLCISLIDTQTIVLLRLSPTQLRYGYVAAGRARDTGPALIPTDLSRRQQSSACPWPCPQPPASHAACSSPPQQVGQGPKTGQGGVPSFQLVGWSRGRGRRARVAPACPHPHRWEDMVD